MRGELEIVFYLEGDEEMEFKMWIPNLQDDDESITEMVVDLVEREAEGLPGIIHGGACLTVQETDMMYDFTFILKEGRPQWTPYAHYN